MGHKHSNYGVKCSFCGEWGGHGREVVLGPHGEAICEKCAAHVLGMMNRNVPPKPQQEQLPLQDRNGTNRFKNITPTGIKDILDKYVIGQHEVKKVVSVAVYNHYRRLLQGRRDQEMDEDLKDVKIEKSNILIAGPTGCGKTLLAKTIAEYLDVPFAIADATTLTEAGYVGEDVENVVRYLWINAGRDKKRTEMGIVVLDEADKIASKTQNVSITRDVSGEGVQQALLKIVEGTICRFTPEGGRKHPEAPLVEIDTSNILFIAGGAFVGLDDVMKRRTSGTTIGFGTEEQNDDDIRKTDENILPEDLIAYGLIPELVGRFPVVAKMEELTEEQLYQVLTQPKNAVTKQYRKLLAIDGRKLVFSDRLLRNIAKSAYDRKTGARGLRAEIEKVMLEVMFRAPVDSKKGDTIEITEEGAKIVHKEEQSAA